MLSFDIINNSNNTNLSKWCNDLSSRLQKLNKATVFITGKVTSGYPQCVSLFSSNNEIDIGSSTYSYSDLTLISDYLAAFEEVRKGKATIDMIGKLNSKVFKAPYGSTDQNIYSLLSRSGILADFSYANPYNKYENGKFIKYDLIAYGPSSPTTVLFATDHSSNSKKPIVINFNSSTPADRIDSYISKIKSSINNIYFTNASKLTGLSLTVRKRM